MLYPVYVNSSQGDTVTVRLVDKGMVGTCIGKVIVSQNLGHFLLLLGILLPLDVSLPSLSFFGKIRDLAFRTEGQRVGFAGGHCGSSILA